MKPKKLGRGAIETKKKILEALEGVKEFELTWEEDVVYSVNIKAKSEKEAKEMFNNGEVEPTINDIVGGDYIDGSLEIAEVDYGNI